MPVLINANVFRYVDSARTDETAAPSHGEIEDARGTIPAIVFHGHQGAKQIDGTEIESIEIVPRFRLVAFADLVSRESEESAYVGFVLEFGAVFPYLVETDVFVADGIQSLEKGEMVDHFVSRTILVAFLVGMASDFTQSLIICGDLGIVVGSDLVGNLFLFSKRIGFWIRRPVFTRDGPVRNDMFGMTPAGHPERYKISSDK